MIVEDRLYTVEEFEEITAQAENHGRLLELIHGEIVEKMPSEEHGMIAAFIIGELYIYLKQHPVGRLGTEIRHRKPGDRHNSRLPDVSFTRETERPVVKKGSVPEMPDLAVKIKSPDDHYSQLREKAEYYLQHGSTLIWLIYPEKRTVEICTRAEDKIVQVQTLTVEDTLTGGDVLPGFSVAVKQIFNLA